MEVEGRLRIWHNSKFPGAAFHREVSSVDEAILLLKTLAYYDLYQGEEVVSMNAQGLEIFEGGEWCEWCSEEGDDIGAYAQGIQK